MRKLRITNVELRKSGIRNQELGISGRKNLLSTLIPNAQCLMPFMTFQRVEAQ